MRKVVLHHVAFQGIVPVVEPFVQQIGSFFVLRVLGDQRQTVVPRVVKRPEYRSGLRQLCFFGFGGRIPVTVARIVCLVVVERENDLLVELVFHIEGVRRSVHQSVVGILHRLFKGRLGLGGLAEREVDFCEERPRRNIGDTGFLCALRRRQQLGRLSQIARQQGVHLVVRTAADRLGIGRGYNLVRNGHTAESPVKVEIPPRPQEKDFTAVFVVIGQFLTAFEVIEHIVTAVNAVVPGVPDIAHDSVAGVLLEMVEIVGRRIGNGHGLFAALVAAVGQFVEVVTHLSFELVVAGRHPLVEVVVGNVVVVLCDAVARVLFEEAVGAGNRPEGYDTQ